jgi:hypothetical protein
MFQKAKTGAVPAQLTVFSRARQGRKRRGPRRLFTLAANFPPAISATEPLLRAYGQPAGRLHEQG